MRTTKFNFRERTYVECVDRSVRRSSMLRAEYSALIKHAYALAETLDDLDCGRDPETGSIAIGRVGRAYVETLKELGLTLAAAEAMGKVRVSEAEAARRGAEPSGPPVEPISLEMFKEKAIAGE